MRGVGRGLGRGGGGVWGGVGLGVSKGLGGPGGGGGVWGNPKAPIRPWNEALIFEQPQLQGQRTPPLLAF